MLRTAWSSKLCILLSVGLAISWQTSTLAQAPFGIQFIDQQSKRPVPLVEIETVDHVKMVSDNQGWIAIDAPELLDAQVFFHIRSHGYEYPKDGFGFTGKTIPCTSGQRLTIELQRVQLAERLYRTTGLGLDAHCKRLEIEGLSVSEYSHNQMPFQAPVGCDSVLTAVMGGKMYWFWGDTQALHYPIGGSFHMTGATTDPNLGDIETRPPSYAYFRDEQMRVRPLAQMPGDGPTWLSGLTVLKDSQGSEVMLANYVKVRNSLEAYRWGFVRWNPKTESFDQVTEFSDPPKLFPPSQVHTLVQKDPKSESDYVYLCGPFPNRRVLATQEAFVDPEQYEGYTCLQDGTSFEDRKLDRNDQGEIVYRWRRNTLPLTQTQEKTLVAEKLMSQAERLYRVLDSDNSHEIQTHNGSVAWNPHRNAWSMVFTQSGGSRSRLGEIWYSESENLEGPWNRAKKIATHHQYSFYNPKIHPEFSGQNGMVLYFEGTYTTTFSGNSHPTPRYDYNQILYRLDLGLLSGVNFEQ